MQTTTKTSDAPAGETTRLVERAAQYLTANLGPLTPAFTPSPDCSSLTVSLYAQAASTSAVWQLAYGETCGGVYRANQPRRVNTDCYPSRYAVAYDALAKAPNSDAVYPVYSPASSCPVGYVSACGFGGSSTTVAPSPSTFEYVMGQILQSTQTAVGCCPSGYTCRNDKPYACASQAQNLATVYADGNSRCISSQKKIWTATAGPEATVVAFAPCLVLVRDQTQTEAGPVTTAPVSGTASNHSDTPAGGSGSGDQGSNSSGSGGLSTGATAAIGASVPLAAIAAGLGLFVYLRRRSRRRRASVDKEEASPRAPGTGGGGGSGSSGIVASPDYDPRVSVNKDQPVSAFSSPVPDRSRTVSPDMNRSSELYGSTVQVQPRLHEDIMELPGEVSAPPALRPISEAP